MAFPAYRPYAAPAQRGVSLIELMVGLTVLAIALMMGVPSLGEWIRNSQIRSTAEALQNGLNFARAEAVRRNTVVRLQFTDTLDDNCALSDTGTHWVANASSSVPPTSLCGHPVDEAVTPFIVQKGNPVATGSGATISATESTIAFNGLGRVASTTNPDVAVGTLTVDVQSSNGACAADSSPMRCLRLVVTPAGQVRMCDPARTEATDPMVCQ